MAIDDHMRLLAGIAQAIKASKCGTEEVVHALISTAAGLAVGEQTHDAITFHMLAHEMFHDAEDVIGPVRPREKAPRGVGGYAN
jgi:hypothetical protein